MNGSSPPLLLDGAEIASPAKQAAQSNAVLRRHQSSLVPMKILTDIHEQPGIAGYVPGEVVGFPEAQADYLEKAGLATRNLDAGPRMKFRRAEMVGGVPTAAASGAVALRLLKPWGSLMPDEIAGFNGDLAHELVVKGIAEKVDTNRPRRTLRSIRDALLGRR